MYAYTEISMRLIIFRGYFQTEVTITYETQIKHINLINMGIERKMKLQLRRKLAI